MKGKTVEIEAKVILSFQVKDGVVICKNPKELSMVMGTTSLAGNYNYYGIEKKGHQYHVKVDTIKERIAEFEQRINNLEQHLSIMRQVVSGGTK